MTHGEIMEKFAAGDISFKEAARLSRELRMKDQRALDLVTFGGLIVALVALVVALRCCS